MHFTIFLPSFDQSFSFPLLQLPSYSLSSSSGFAGRAIGGFTVSPHVAMMGQVREWHRVNGLHVSPANSCAILEGFSDIRERMETSGRQTEELLAELIERGHGKELIHPSLPEHPSYGVFHPRNLVKLSPAVFLIKSRFVSKNQLQKRTDGTNGTLEWKTSYGGPRSSFATSSLHFPSSLFSSSFSLSLSCHILHQAFSYYLISPLHS